MATFIGTAGADIISPDLISAGVTIVPAGSNLDGDDTITGAGGDDLVVGGRGNDVASLGPGRDRFVWNPGDGDDVMNGGGNADTLEFNGSDGTELMTVTTLPSGGLSLRWYRSVAMDPDWRSAAQNSVVVATLATAIAATLGTAAGCGIAFLRARLAALAYALMLVPMVTLVIVVALAVYLAFNAWGLTETRAGLVLAHAALGLPFVVVTTAAAMRKYDQRLFFAALSLGASYPSAFRHAVLPSLAPAMLAGGLYAFQASFDESIIVLFLARAGQETLPQRIFAGLTDNITPAVAVVAVATTTASIVLLAVYCARTSAVVPTATILLPWTATAPSMITSRPTFIVMT